MQKLVKYSVALSYITLAFSQEKDKEGQKDNDELSQSLVLIVCVLLILGLLYFAYNFYVCHKKKIAIGQEDDDEERHQEIEFPEARKEQRIY